MAAKPVKISMTTFADFVVADPLGQLARIRDVRRQYQQPYSPGGDFWSRWREGVERIHSQGEGREALRPIGKQAKDNRAEQYTSACAGYAKFWGRKQIELRGHPKPALWVHDALQVKVNPEWVLGVKGEDVIVKVHLKEKLTLNQRLSNPLLHLMDLHFGPSVGGPSVAILDVHRGRLWRQKGDLSTIDAVLHMQAAAFLAGWVQLDTDLGGAA